MGNEGAWPATPEATVYIPRAIPEIESVTVEFLDPDSADLDHRFYRLRGP